MQVEPDDVIDDPFKYVTGREHRKKYKRNTAPSGKGFETHNRYGSLRFNRNNDCVDKEEQSTEESSDDEQHQYRQSYPAPPRSVRSKKHRSRPDNVVNKHPEKSTTLPVRPGHKDSYSEAVTDGKCVMVFSTSMTKGIQVREFNKRLNNGIARFRRFHGGRVRHLHNYVDTHLEDENPEVVVIQEGGNDLPTKKNNPSSVKDIATQIIKTGQKCLSYGVKTVLIASIITRKKHYMDQRRIELNKYLQAMCLSCGFKYINNDNITHKHLDEDGVHLTKSGSSVLASNFRNALNDVL